MSTPTLSELADFDRLIHEPARLIILAVLYSLEESDFLYLQRETGLTKGNLSAHLTKLETAGYVEIEKTYRGRTPMTILQINAPGREAFEAYCSQMRQFINTVKP